MESAFPTRYVKIRTQEVYHLDLSDALFRTLAQIRGLAHPTRGRRTPRLTIGNLATLRGLGRATIFKHLAELRERGIIQTEPVGEHAFVIHLLRWKPGEAAQAEGETTPPGDRDDGTAGPAGGHHHVACFPPGWEPGTALPVHERGDAPPAEHEGLPQPGRNGCGTPGVNSAGDTRQQAESQSLKDETRSLKNETQSLKNETRACHVVVKDHDSKQEEDLKQQHDGAILENESAFEGVRQELAEVLVEHGMAPGDAARKARRLLEAYGVEVCARQRQAFERRCELARASQQGLRNPVGLLCASIRGDWSLPPVEGEHKTRRWYTDEEFEMFFEH